MSTQSILYIEDEEDYQILVKHMLARAGLQADMAATGEEGLGALRTHRPSMLLLDINLPDTDGYSICSQLRQDSAWVDLPILMLTVRRRPEEWLRGFSSGANDYLSKPLDPAELIERVKNCLNGKAQRFSNPGTPEYHLIQAAIAGNRAAFEVLIQKYKTRLIEGIRLSGRNAEEAEDIVSHAFVVAFEKMGRFRGEASFYTWLYRIAMNETFEVTRKSNNLSIEEMTRGDETALPAALTEPNPVPEDLADRLDRNRLREALGQVPEPYRAMLEMYFVKDLPYQAIADHMNLPLGTVMSRLHTARQMLKETWGSASTATSVKSKTT